MRLPWTKPEKADEVIEEQRKAVEDAVEANTSVMRGLVVQVLSRASGGWPKEVTK